MAVLPTEDRRRIWAHLMRQLGAVPDVTKPELRSAVDATDVWINDNAASFNAALPSAFRDAGTAGQKARLLAFVVMRRFGNLRTEDD